MIKFVSGSTVSLEKTKKAAPMSRRGKLRFRVWVLEKKYVLGGRISKPLGLEALGIRENSN